MSDLLIRRRNLLIRKQEEEMNIRAVCFKADGEQTVAITKVGSAPAITMQYSYDGVNWDAWDLTALPFGGNTKVYVRGVNNNRIGISPTDYYKFVFGTDAYVYVSGIIESLLDGDNEVLTYRYTGILRNLFYQQTALRSAQNLRFEVQSMLSDAQGEYTMMFKGCTNLISAPKLSATTVGPYACQYMFQDCKSLLNAPELPATTLAKYCYQYMFQGCTSLISAPKISATKLASNCYRSMFQDCSSLLTAPELPATTLANGCYIYMFKNCSSLVNAPELPANTTADYSYGGMFQYCTSLKSIRCRAKSKADNPTNQWLSGVAASGTFYGHSEYGWSSGASGIPSGWEFVELTD